MNDGANDRISSWSHSTHHDTCWHDHLDCAAVLIAELTTQRDLARRHDSTREQEVWDVLAQWERDHSELVSMLIEARSERDLAREVAVALEQEVAVLTTERDGEIERLRIARQDAYDEVAALRQEVEQLRSSWGFIRDGA